MTELSDRERELVEAVREYLRRKDEDWESHDALRLRDSLRAYDPKPEKKYTMPEWGDFIQPYINTFSARDGVEFIVLDNDFDIANYIYNAIREATTKPSED